LDRSLFSRRPAPRQTLDCLVGSSGPGGPSGSAASVVTGGGSTAAAGPEAMHRAAMIQQAIAIAVRVLAPRWIRTGSPQIRRIAV
jgi:hypothetical protein